MQINKELSHLKNHLLEGKTPEISFLKGSPERAGFLPFFLGINVGWIVALILWKLCVKHAEKTGLGFFEWLEQKLTKVVQAQESASFEAEETAAPTPKSAAEIVEVEKAPKKSVKKVVKAKKAPAKKTKSISKKLSATSKTAKAEEKKAPKKSSKTTKKTIATSSKAKKKVKKIEDKA